MINEHHPHDVPAPPGPGIDTAAPEPASATAGPVSTARPDGSAATGDPKPDAAPLGRDRDDDTVLLRPVDTDPGPAPIFVDATGRRRRRLRNLAYAAGVLGLGYAALVGVSIAGGSTFPQVLIPLPEQIGGPAPATAPARPPVTLTTTAVTGTPPSTGRNLPDGRTGSPGRNTEPTATARPTGPRPESPVEPPLSSPNPPAPVTPPPVEPSTEATVDPTPPVPSPPGTEPIVAGLADPR